MDNNNTEENRLGRVKQHYGTKGKPPVIQPKPQGRKLKIKPTSSPVVDQPPPSLGTTTTYNGKKDSNSDEEVWSISEYLFLLFYFCTCTCPCTCTHVYINVYVHVYATCTYTQCMYMYLVLLC